MIRQVERDDPLDLWWCEFFLWFWPQLFLSILLLTYLFTTNKSGIRESKKKSRCVYGSVKLFEPGGFRPKIDSLQTAKLVIIDQEGRVANNSLITHGDCLLTTEHQNGNANWRLPPFLYSQKYRGSLVFCWARLMFLSCMWVSSCLWGDGSG